MENDERHALDEVGGTPTPPNSLTDGDSQALDLIQGGRTPTGRHPLGVIRGASPAGILAQQRGRRALAEAFPGLTEHAPKPLAPAVEHQGLCWLLEEDLGSPEPEALDRLAHWGRCFLEARCEPQPAHGPLRELLRLVAPQGLPRSARLVAALRQARADGAALPFAPKLGAIERALDTHLELELTRTWAHGALTPARLLTHGACHWARFGPDGWLGQDLAAFVEPEPEDPAGALLALSWGWRWDAERAAHALAALGVVEEQAPAWVELALAQPHPCLSAADLERLLGVAPGRVPATAAARALGRGQGLVVGGTPLQLEVTPRVRARRSAAPWRVRDRDPTRLFSRWHEGVRIDPDARASLTPEAAALATAHRMGAATVVDAFCGAGGNAIAFARMPWCRQVIAVDLDPARLAMARHNAGLYGVQDKIRFVQGDFLELAPALAPSAQACFLDPPWAAGPALAERAWSLARAHFPRGALKQPRQWAGPAGASALEPVFGVGSIISWVQAWWGPAETRQGS